MPQNFEEVEGACWFRVVRTSVHLWVRSSHFLMRALSYEQCMLGLWNFIDGFFMKKWLTLIFFFLSELSPFLELCPLKIRMKSCQQDIWKSIWPRNLILGGLIEDDEWITGLISEQILSVFSELWPFENLIILNLSIRYVENYLK